MIQFNQLGSIATVNSQLGAAASEVLAFHQKLPHYKETPLHSLPQLAEELQLGHVFLKDESNRFGLPSFKILGASWAIFRVLAERLDLDVHHLIHDTREPESLWQQIGSRANSAGLTLVTCTEGNWGRAVARMAKYIGMPARIFVPSFMPEITRDYVRSEGAELIVIEGNYDDSVAAAKKEAGLDKNATLVMDMGWDGYEKVPQVSHSTHPPGTCSAMNSETDIAGC